MKNPFRRQAPAPDTAELTARVSELEATLRQLYAAVDGVKTGTLVHAGTIRRNTSPDGSMVVRAPHVQDPAVAMAMRTAESVLKGGQP